MSEHISSEMGNYVEKLQCIVQMLVSRCCLSICEDFSFVFLRRSSNFQTANVGVCGMSPLRVVTRDRLNVRLRHFVEAKGFGSCDHKLKTFHPTVHHSPEVEPNVQHSFAYITLQKYLCCKKMFAVG